MLTFESFDIEAHPECRYDYVKVSFGSDEQRYCGSNKPSPIISSNNTMVVIFRSDDHEGHNNGFKATWKAGEPGMSFGHVILLAHFITNHAPNISNFGRPISLILGARFLVKYVTNF